MKEEQWSCRATELQDAFDRNGMKAFYDGLKVVYDSRDTGSNSVHSCDSSTLITDHVDILSRWIEHFHSVLNQKAAFDSSVLWELPNWTLLRT